MSRNTAALAALVAALTGGVARGDSSTGTRPPGGLLRFDGTLRATPDVPTFVTLDVRELRLLGDGGKVLWRRPPPRSLAQLTIPERARAEAYLRDPAARAESLQAGIIDTLVRSDGVVVVTDAGLMVLDRRDGHVLVEQWLEGVGISATQFTDAAQVTVDCEGGRRVELQARGGRFVADCGSRLVVHHGIGIIVVKTRPFSLAGTHTFPEVIQRKDPRAFDETLHVGGANIRVRSVESGTIRP